MRRMTSLFSSWYVETSSGNRYLPGDVRRNNFLQGNLLLSPYKNGLTGVEVWRDMDQQPQSFTVTFASIPENWIQMSLTRLQFSDEFSPHADFWIKNLTPSTGPQTVTIDFTGPPTVYPYVIARGDIRRYSVHIWNYSQSDVRILSVKIR